VTARPDAEQEVALASTARHLVVVAPPGTGKTSLAARLAARHAVDLPDHQRVLLLTFSNQARSELEREVALHVPAALRRRIEVTNYHRFFWGLTHRYRRALRLPDGIHLTSANRRAALIRGATRQYSMLGVALDECAELLVAGIHPVPAVDPDELDRALAVVETEHEAGRVVFGDFGAFWGRLIAEQPTVRRAMQIRYPVVIADEHQDASAIQEALIRELGDVHVVFADPMQLIHAFRGADWARLQRHLVEADETLELRTPHRWHDSPTLGRWLLDVRARLRGEARPGARPREVVVTMTEPARGLNGMLAALPDAVRRAREDGARTIAVMAWSNSTVAALRRYLCRQGLEPAQLGIWHAFDRLVDLPEQLRTATPDEVALLVLDSIAGLAPGLESTDLERAKDRLSPGAIRTAGAGPMVATLLVAAAHGHEQGAAGYFKGVVYGVDALAARGVHVPALEEVRLYRQAATAADLDEQLESFGSTLIAASQHPSRTDRGVLTMTVHQSKGREFDAVVLFDANANSFRPAAEDTVRLFYVAITRARRHWEIIAPRGNVSPLVDSLGTA
jgi:hypothetical protein